MISVLEDTRFDSKPQLGDHLCIFERNKGKDTTKAVALDMKKYVCAKFRSWGRRN